MTDNTWTGRAGGQCARTGKREEGEGAEPSVNMKVALFGWSSHEGELEDGATSTQSLDCVEETSVSQGRL